MKNETYQICFEIPDTGKRGLFRQNPHDNLISIIIFPVQDGVIRSNTRENGELEAPGAS